MAIQFEENYQVLELEHGASWATATKNYRRLVNIWHPDRFTQRPRERVHAQQNFIELTKAFNNLRAFYRENNRLPYEPLKQSVADAPEPPPHQRVSLGDKAALESGILNKRKPSAFKRKRPFLKTMLWSLPICAALIGGIYVFMLVDRSAKMATIEDAKRVLSKAQPSEFMKDDGAIRRANNRSAIINSSNNAGAMGEQLSKDMFK